jgi:hypothetical protein
VVFTLPIARFEAGNALHQNLAAAAREAEAVAAAVALPEGVRFQRARKLGCSTEADRRFGGSAGPGSRPARTAAVQEPPFGDINLAMRSP